MERRTTIIAIIIPATIAAVAGAGIARAVGSDDSRSITGPALERASRAALDATGGGRVTETEVGDEDSYYEVEVTLDDGRQVDVQLDRAFAVVTTMRDHDSATDTGEDG